jgi:poly(A) polymerase
MSDAAISTAPWLKTPATRAVIAALEAARAGASRFVGGCVRNALIGAPVDDIDIATQLTPGDVINAAEKAGLAAHPTGIEHGTITVVAGYTPYEVTTLRRDLTTDGRRATVAFTEDWSEDAARRDFRMNALYAAPDGTLFDPTDAGLEDIAARRVVFIGDAETRIREDYLRILRFFRFNAWYGRGALDATGLAACAALKSGLAGLSVERIWKETKKLAGAPDPRAALAAMEESGVRALALPEFARRERMTRLIAVENEMLLGADAMTRIAAALDTVEDARALARRLKLSNEERERLVAALGETPRIVSYLSMREVERALYWLGPEAFTDRARIAWAEDAVTKTAPQWQALLALAATWTRPKLPLSGEEVIAAGVAPGPKVGAVMREVEAWWVDAGFPDDKLSIVERLKALTQALG